MMKREKGGEKREREKERGKERMMREERVRAGERYGENDEERE